MKPQWYVNCHLMGKQAVDAVRQGDLQICPNQFDKIWYSWMENVHDWCISRQLWWGHRVPAYFIRIDGQEGDVCHVVYRRLISSFGL